MVKSVAIFEAIKGAIVLLAGFGLLSLLHRDIRALALELVGRLHLDPAKRYPSIFIEAAAKVTDGRLWFIAGFACVYAAFRITEAYGLWKARTWAEWLAVISGAIYLPVEIYEVSERFTWVRITALISNLAVVVLMAIVLAQNRKRAAAGQPPVAA
ncbi:MAG: putative rane protein [Verrucomicrobia bacterium]|nr:putative rane protein [Verrucomicrobiota bacterium]